MIRYQLGGPSGAPVVVLSNSLGTTLAMWDGQMPGLGQFRVLRYDTRGHGASPVTPGPYSIGQLAQDVIAMLDSLNIDRVHFCGISLGGMTGLWLGTHYAARLQKLVLCNTAPRIGTVDAWNTRIELVRKEGIAAVIPATLERWFTPAFRDDAKVAAIRHELQSANLEGYLACCAAVRDMDAWEQVSTIAVPTLVMGGQHDPVTPPADCQAMAGKIPNARYVELPAAHLSNIEAALKFTQEMVGFLLAPGA